MKSVCDEGYDSIPVLVVPPQFTDRGVYSVCALAAGRDDIFVVRGTSKFFATPGIRLGYGVTGDDALIAALSEHLSLWGINIYAELMGREMFSDEAYKAKTYHLIESEKERMCARLEAIDALKVFPSYGNFVLVKIRDRSHTAKELRSALLKKKMVIRDCSNFKNLDERFFRFCILRDPENEMLLREIEAFFKKRH